MTDWIVLVVQFHVITVRVECNSLVAASDSIVVKLVIDIRVSEVSDISEVSELRGRRIRITYLYYLV